METDRHECVERHRTYPHVAHVCFRLLLLLLLLGMIITIMCFKSYYQRQIRE